MISFKLAIVQLVFAFLGNFVNGFPGFHMNNKNNLRTSRQILSLATDEDGGKKAKLPILQIIENSKLDSEFFFGNDMEGSLAKLKSKLNIKDNLNGNSKYIENAYSDEMLNDVIQSGDTVVLKLFRDGCNKCLALAPIYEDLSKTCEDSSIRWAQANVRDIPVYLKSIKKRLLGKTSRTSDQNSDDSSPCSVCNGEGLVSCTKCDGTGVVQRGEFTVFCPDCVGKKVVRCARCGGKCINC